MAPRSLIRRLLGKKHHTHDDSPIPTFFQTKAAQHGYTLSAAQAQAIAAMARETRHLLAGQPTRSLYLHGPVGRGKS